eukprot:TRINITY_DN7177_c0_g1_i1.p2 TRINITY_DN7177_c0_g1~~TRINITY_DN7177_c0_g1_i1.p2  ORF type:complete len:122 (+),score=29.85 TRINITY_DN7177_c0_g1_i1:37-366(+)
MEEYEVETRRRRKKITDCVEEQVDSTTQENLTANKKTQNLNSIEAPSSGNTERMGMENEDNMKEDTQNKDNEPNSEPTIRRSLRVRIRKLREEGKGEEIEEPKLSLIHI